MIYNLKIRLVSKQINGRLNMMTIHLAHSIRGFAVGAILVQVTTVKRVFMEIKAKTR